MDATRAPVSTFDSLQQRKIWHQSSKFGMKIGKKESSCQTPIIDIWLCYAQLCLIGKHSESVKSILRAFLNVPKNQIFKHCDLESSLWPWKYYFYEAFFDYFFLLTIKKRPKLKPCIFVYIFLFTFQDQQLDEGLQMEMLTCIQSMEVFLC